MMQKSVSAEMLEKMIEKAYEKLASAQRELDGKHYGEAASRAYYEVFHALSAVPASRGLAFSSHSQTIGAFNKHFVKEGCFDSSMTRNLQRLFEDRQIADYDWIQTVDEQTGTEDVCDAGKIVRACELFIKSSPEA